MESEYIVLMRRNDDETVSTQVEIDAKNASDAEDEALQCYSENWHCVAIYKRVA